MVRQLLRTAYRSKFIRNVTVLTGGSIVAQLIPLLMLPIFTRIFDAKVFGMLALLQVGGGLIAILATGSYDLAIPTPRQASRARGLATTALTFALVMTVLTAIGVVLLHDWILRQLNTPEMGDWLYVYPAIVLGISLMNIANYWLLRADKLVKQTSLKIVFSLSTAMLTLILRHQPYGLLYGFLGGLGIGTGWAILQAMRNGFYPALQAPSRYFWHLLRKYGHFPMFGSLPSLVQNCAAQIPLLIVTANYSLTLTGHYSMARNLLLAGTNLIATSVSQIILKHISERRQRGERVWPHFIRITCGLAVFALIATASILIIGPWFFHLYLGKGWEDASTLIRMLGFSVFFWIMGMTLGSAMTAVHKIRFIAYWQLLYGVLGSCLFFFTYLPFAEFVWCVVGFEIVLYAFYTVLILVVMRRYDRQQMQGGCRPHS